MVATTGFSTASGVTGSSEGAAGGTVVTALPFLVRAPLPKTTLTTERFIARHITRVSTEPDAATVAPQATSSVLPSMTPQKAAAKPAVAFNTEMSTGMSAPPIRMASTTPAARAHSEAIESAIITAPPAASPAHTQEAAARAKRTISQNV